MASSAPTRPVAAVPSPSSAALQLGLRLHEAGDVTAAEEVYRTILDTEPKHGDALNLLGTALAQQGKVSEGLEWISAALEIDPAEPTYRMNHAEAHFQIGCEAMRAGATTQAIEAFSTALESDPEHRDAHMNLGATQYEAGRLTEAEASFQAILDAAPGNQTALHNLARVRQRRGDAFGALQALWNAVEANPDDAVIWGDFADAFQRSVFHDALPVARLESIAVALLERDDVDHRALGAQVVRLWKRNPVMARLLELAREGTEGEFAAHLFEGGGMKALQRPIVRLALERTVVPDLASEALFTRLRRIALETFVSGRHAIPPSFLISLARQCHLNGYVWNLDKNQVAEVEWLVHSAAGRGLGEPGDVSRIALLGCFLPLGHWERAREVVMMVTELNDPALAGLVLQQILEPLQEQEIRQGIPHMGPIDDTTSQAVREQYEEHPYPRWTTYRRHRPSSISEAVRSIAGADLDGDEERVEPRVLVAGCGTGRHLFETVERFPNADVTGIDLSLTSLSYASRKLTDAGHDWVRLLQADILNLEGWDERFDLVDSSGVLHHMADPAEGWRVLAGLVRHGGYMRVGLYSALARRRVEELRDFIDEIGYPSTPEGIRDSRQAMAVAFSDQSDSPTAWRDYFSMEECRDLLFHAQEHRMTIPEISQIVSDLGLDFLGFEIPDPRIREAFQAAYPEAGAMRSFDCWHAFEHAHPDTFGRMYQLWLRKP